MSPPEQSHSPLCRKLVGIDQKIALSHTLAITLKHRMRAQRENFANVRVVSKTLSLIPSEAEFFV